MKLRELCTIQSGGTPSRSKPEFWENGSIPWVKISDFDGKYVSHTEEKITECGLLSSSAKVFPKGTMLYTIFATLGEVCILDIDAATNQAIAGITIKNDNVDEDYLFYFLTSLKTYVNRIGRGVAQNNINMSILREIEVPLPSIVRQKRIADILGKADQLIEKKERQLITLDELVKSRFIEIVNEKQPIKTAEEVCSVIIDCPHSTPRYDEAALIYPSIRTSEIRNGEIDWSSMKYVGENEYYERTKRLTPQPGDIVYAREGTYGDCVILPVGYSFCLGQRTMLFRPDGVICNSIYLHQALRSDDVKRQADESNAGSTVPHVNVADAKKFSFPLPSIAVQSRFAAFVAEVDKSKLAVKQSLEKLETLKKSLMQQYFG